MRPTTGKEFAEELVILKPHTLDADDQSLKTDDKDGSQSDHKPVAYSMDWTDQLGQDKEHSAQAYVGHRKRTYTHVGKAVAQETDHRLEQLKEHLNGIGG